MVPHHTGICIGESFFNAWLLSMVDRSRIPEEAERLWGGGEGGVTFAPFKSRVLLTMEINGKQLILTLNGQHRMKLMAYTNRPY